MDGVQVVFITFGLHRQLGYVVRAAMWMGLWFGIGAAPLNWAQKASNWNDKAGEAVWTEAFLDVHRVMWKVLLSFLLYTVTGLLSAVAGKALSLQFHHANHFERMQVRLTPCCCLARSTADTGTETSKVLCAP
jgi:hypothetical protein